jgi:hypothetical protein
LCDFPIVVFGESDVPSVNLGTFDFVDHDTSSTI